MHSVVESRKDVYKHILPNVEEVEDQAVWYPIRMKPTGSHTFRKIRRIELSSQHNSKVIWAVIDILRKDANIRRIRS